MPFSSKKAVCQRLAWYRVPQTGYCHLIALDDDLVALPTPSQEALIVYPDDNPQQAGHFFASYGGQLFNLN